MVYLSLGGNSLITSQIGQRLFFDDLKTATPSVFISRDTFPGLVGSFSKSCVSCTQPHHIRLKLYPHNVES